jgi:hypothetical protein
MGFFFITSNNPAPEQREVSKRQSVTCGRCHAIASHLPKKDDASPHDVHALHAMTMLRGTGAGPFSKLKPTCW